MSQDAQRGAGRPRDAFDATEPCAGVKRLATARARASLVGAELLRTDPTDGAVRYYVQCGDVVCQIRTLDDLEAVLVGDAAPYRCPRRAVGL